ncbi:amidohydrolase family protein [Halobacillus naozhouensis]|uniref:Amidohydrolase family protein n=1 Tax=Halobacillus naozhouensis TaxID=554880 RepID=A0ABY8IZT0_9BACI|nr:amidohydrolase family protein [Halobacillus naozhouensis]WFT74136.1 amidohydrolase family protein [Halobacillus naozhouensis]
MYRCRSWARHRRTNNKVNLDSAKLFQDGSIQGYTAALREPYYSDESVKGNLLHDQRAFNEEILGLHERGFRIAIHGNGDKAIESNINALQEALTMAPREDHRHRIEHVQTASFYDLKLTKKLGIAASFFINHVYYWGERHRDIFLGAQKAASKGNVLGESQKIDVLTALRSMTSYGAAINFEENDQGTIEVGKKADFVVLEDSPLSCLPEEIKDIPILSTIIDGKIVWTNKIKSIV